jgi:NAD(P)H-nitrite reductase large subunit
MNYVIIGGSAASTAAAREIRQRDPGGRIRLFTRDPAFYSRCQLHLLASGHRQVAQANFLPHAWAERFRIEVFHDDAVTGIDTGQQRVRTSAGREAAYDRLLIATGARTALPPVAGLAGSRTFGFRDLADAEALRAALPGGGRLVIIGAGLVGCELAAELARDGHRVSLVEMAPHPLPLQLEAETGALAASLLSAAGIDLHCQDRVARVERDAAGLPVAVHLASGTALPADLMVVAAGVKANTELATGVGITTNRGILIDRQCRTNLPAIFAAGDVTESEDVIVHQIMPSAIWPAAVRQGQVAGAVMAGDTDSLARNTGLRASVSLCGTSVVAIGPVNQATADHWTKRVYRYRNSRGHRCVKIFFTDGCRLKAAILWGEITNAGVYGEAIINGRDIHDEQIVMPDLDGARRGIAELSIR